MLSVALLFVEMFFFLTLFKVIILLKYKLLIIFAAVGHESAEYILGNT